jgi:hypothetical protein
MDSPGVLGLDSGGPKAVATGQRLAAATVSVRPARVGPEPAARPSAGLGPEAGGAVPGPATASPLEKGSR